MLRAFRADPVLFHALLCFDQFCLWKHTKHTFCVSVYLFASVDLSFFFLHTPNIYLFIYNLH